MASIPFSKELRLHTVKKALILNELPVFLDELGEYPEESILEQKISGKYEYTYLFVNSLEELNKIHPEAVLAIPRLRFFIPLRSIQNDNP